MSTLKSALDELGAEDLDHLNDEALEADFLEMERADRALRVERARRLAEIHRRQTFRRDGYLSTSAWLRHHLKVGWGPAASQVREASALQDMPATRRALAEGEISSSAVAMLIRAREAHPDEFRAGEEALVDAAATLEAWELSRALAYWQQALDAPGAYREAERLRELRRLHVSRTLEGMVRVDGDLDPETGATVMAALQAVMDAELRGDGARDDLRSSPQCRADALGEVCRQWLDGSDRLRVAGERPHVTVMVDLEALEGRAESTSEFEDGGPVHPEVVRRWACDASISRVITRGRSEPLDVGRRIPAVSAALRRALVVRDTSCRFPGCKRPNPWCDAHHVVHWADGGATALENPLLLCRPHHRLVHGPGGFGLDLTEQGPVFRRPDGSVLEDRAPP